MPGGWGVRRSNLQNAAARMRRNRNFADLRADALESTDPDPPSRPESPSYSPEATPPESPSYSPQATPPESPTSYSPPITPPQSPPPDENHPRLLAVYQSG
jgi:hypothetical protein